MLRILDPGHKYELQVLDAVSSAQPRVVLQFVKRVGLRYPGNLAPSYAGTTLQEVWRACCDRLKYVNKQLPCLESEMALWHIRSAIALLEIRAARRHGRILDLTELSTIEQLETCPLCLHIGCKGECRKGGKE